MHEGWSLSGTQASEASQNGYRIADETDGLKLQPASYNNVVASGSWNGVSWFPGCYAGDYKPHVFKIGLIVDPAAARKHGSRLNYLVQSVIARTSLIFESQLNIKVEIADLQVYTSDSSAPSYVRGCPGIYQQLAGLTKASGSGQVPFNGARHLLTGCGNGWGIVGVAYVGSMCSSSYNTGVSQLRNEMSWLIFAHELGHNFGGEHSFEEGQGSTGGIMDYGDGKLNGEYQFNTKYRKDQMCSLMNSTVNKCQGKFAAAPPSPPTPSPSPPPPSPSPPPPSPSPPPPGSCSYGLDACRAAAERLGLKTTGIGSYGFSGIYSETACYAYSDGALRNYAWYGLRGDGAEVQSESDLTAVQSGKYRLDGTHNCGSNDDGGSPCEDLNSNCPKWESYGYCTGQYEKYMSANCRLWVPAWAANAYCTTGAYVDFMRNVCQKSCQTCGLGAYSKEPMQAPPDAPSQPPKDDDNDDDVMDDDLLSRSAFMSPGRFIASTVLCTVLISVFH
jgi:hypothetical protein